MSVLRVLPCLSLLLSAACGPSSGEEVGASSPDISYEEFEAQTYHEGWEHGVYIVNGDTPIVDGKALREFYDVVYGGQKLIVHAPGGVDAVWSAQQKLNLTYCVSDNFGELKDDMIAAMQAATDNGWETAANIDFVHVPSEDANCDANNQNVVFDVGLVFNQPYLARAFFPDQSRETRNVFVDQSSFEQSSIPLEGILIHELGHALGYLHVTTRISIMNPAIGPAPTEFDRDAALIAFERMPGNQSPDSDVADGPRSPDGIGRREIVRHVWAPPLP